MMRRLLFLAALALASCAPVAEPVRTASADFLAAPAAEEWLSDGRDYTAQRYSPLTQITAANVGQLGLAWFAELDTFRGVEGTPVYADGVIYNTSAWNITTAYNAATGALLWRYDPQVDRQQGRFACCEPVARGLALWRDKAIIATLDGRLIALDRATGQPQWTTQTFTHAMPYTITGAPRVFDGKVVVGQSGGDLGVRGFVAAWDAQTGAQVWKFFLTPGNPADGPDGAASDPIMPMIRATWAGEYWRLGGGGNAWDSIAYDPENRTVFVGTGNGSPLSRYHRSNNEGDNLFVCSIVALDADTGAYKWHYQMVPGEDWDYTCTSSIISADLVIEGRTRHVIMQAPKNGFFYVIDRETGELISAAPHVKVNWGHVDPATGHMVVNETARYGTDPVLVYPGPGGAHNWFPMAFSPRTGLAYFPAYQSGLAYALDPDFVPQPFRSNAGWGGYTGAALQHRIALMAEAAADEKAWLTAWDPVAQTARWQVELPRHGNGGVMVTASDLVFEGTTRQTFTAFDARDGRELWSFPTQSAPVAGPITYMLGGVQYVAVNAGWGGGAAQQEQSAGTELPRASARLLVFRLGGAAQLPPLAAVAAVPPPPRLRASEAEVTRGAQLFAQTCAVCHGQRAIGGVKDLRHMDAATHARFADIVLRGAYLEKGMASFADLLDEDEVRAIHAYLIARANEDWGEGGN